MGVAESNINFAIIIDNEIVSIINRYKNMDITEINNNMISIKDTANREGDILNGEFTGTVKLICQHFFGHIFTEQFI